MRYLHDNIHKKAKNPVRKLFDTVLWNSPAFSFLESYPFNDTDNYYVIVTDYGVDKIDFNRVKNNKRGNVKYVLLFLNPLSRDKTRYAQSNTAFFDLVLSFDPDDCKKHGFDYYPLVYSKREIASERTTDSDKSAYFVGYDKGRGELLSGIAERLQEIGVRCVFKVKQGSANKRYPNLTYLSGILPYDKVLEDIAATDCIVEIIQPGQSGATLRYAEAVCYNKILITTNKMITELPCYNAKYMHIIEKPEDIEPSWFQLNEPIEYNYNGEFSPKKLLAFVEEQLTT